LFSLFFPLIFRARPSVAKGPAKRLAFSRSAIAFTHFPNLRMQDDCFVLKKSLLLRSAQDAMFFYAANLISCAD